jgi:hypothetical protein
MYSFASTLLESAICFFTSETALGNRFPDDFCRLLQISYSEHYDTANRFLEIVAPLLLSLQKRDDAPS